MEIQVQLTTDPIPEKISPPASGTAGAWAEFRGIVRGEENGAPIAALEYEAYPGMAESEIRRLLIELSQPHPCHAVVVIHRVGLVPVGETAIYVGVAARNRGPAFAVLAGFMDRLKQDVPIWKRRAIFSSLSPSGERVGVRGPLSAENSAIRNPQSAIAPLRPPDSAIRNPQSAIKGPLSLADALAEINSHIRPLPAVRVPLAEAAGRILREPVHASEDSPSSARSTRDGYALLQDDPSEELRVVDTLHAADWKPRQLQPGEAVRVATGAALPCENLRVIMQEHVQRDGDTIKILRREKSLNLRQRGEEWRAGDELLVAGRKLDAGALALLASAGCVRPLTAPRLRALHFTTGDEIIPPDQSPKPGQVRDSNSILIRALLERAGCQVTHRHLPEDFEQAKAQIGHWKLEVENADLVLVSGGASVGDKDFTRPLLEWLGFEIVFNRLNLRPGAPLIFGVASEGEGSCPSLAGADSSLAGAGEDGRRPGEGCRDKLKPSGEGGHRPDEGRGAETNPVGEGDRPLHLRGQGGVVGAGVSHSLEVRCPPRVAFGLPGNPLSHFVCYHAFVAAALARLTGSEPAGFLRGTLAEKLEDAPNPRETLWPAQASWRNGRCELHPLPWSSSGDVLVLAQADALIRLPAGSGPLAAGAEVEYMPTKF